MHVYRFGKICIVFAIHSNLIQPIQIQISPMYVNFFIAIRTVVIQKHSLHSCPQFRQTLANFHNSFTVGSEFANKCKVCTVSRLMKSVS